MKMTNPRVNSQFVIATLAEFVRVWDLGEDASLHLETTKGHATVAFNCKLGPPSAPHPIPTFPPPPPPPWRSRHHRGPAQREKNRQRAACYQASKRAAATAVTSPTTLPTSASVVATSTPSTTTLSIPSPAITVPVKPSPATAPLVSVTSSTTSSAVSAVSPLRPLTSSGYGSVRADPTVAPSEDMYFDEQVKVYGFIFALVSELKSCGRRGATGPKVRCDKCQFHGSWHLKKSGLRKHRQEKHRIWECLCCGAAFPNSIDFKNHIDEKNCVLHPLGMPYLGCGSDDPHPIIWYALP